MTIATEVSGKDGAARREKLFTAINRASSWLSALGLGWLTPILRIAAGDSPREQMRC